MNKSSIHLHSSTATKSDLDPSNPSHSRSKDLDRIPLERSTQVPGPCNDVLNMHQKFDAMKIGMSVIILALFTYLLANVYIYGQPVAVMRLGSSSMAVVVAFMGVVIAFVNVCFFIYRRYIKHDRLKRRKKRIWHIISKKLEKMKKKEGKDVTKEKSRWTYTNRFGSLFSSSFALLVLVALCMLIGVAGALPSFCVLKSTTTCEGLNHEMVQK